MQHRVRSQLAPLIAARAFSVLVMEMDESDQPPWRTAEELGCLLHSQGYSLYLKVPCASQPPWSQRARYVPISGAEHSLLPEEFGKGGLGSRARCSLGGWGCLVQDLLALDTTRRPELKGLIKLGEEGCELPMPSVDETLFHPKSSLGTIGDSGKTQTAGNRSGGSGSGSFPWRVLTTENARFEGRLRQPKPAAPLMPSCLPDGSWSCGRAPKWGADRRPSCLVEEQGNRGGAASERRPMVTCQDLWSTPVR